MRRRCVWLFVLRPRAPFGNTAERRTKERDFDKEALLSIPLSCREQKFRRSERSCASVFKIYGTDGTEPGVIDIFGIEVGSNRAP